MKGENRMTKDELIRKMYEIRKEGFELTRKSLSKIDANIYTNAEDIFGSWVAAKKEFYEYERQLKKKERAEKAAKNKNKNKSNRKPKVETVEVDTNDTLNENNEENNVVSTQNSVLEPITETVSTQIELPVNDTTNNDKSDSDILSELEKSIFKNIDNALTERDKECLSSGIMPHNLINLFSGFKEDFISKYIKYFMANNSLSKDSILKIVKENISAEDIVLTDLAKVKFEHIHANILEKFNSIEHALIELIKR